MSARPGRKVPVGPAAAHVRHLVEQGASLTGIAKAAGCAYTTIQQLHAGLYQQINADLADQIRTVTADHASHRGPGRPPGAHHDPEQLGDWADHPDRPCANVPLATFFPEKKRTGRRGGVDAGYKAAVAHAKHLCSTCPVLDDCRAHAIAHEQWGIWGGLTETEREAARRRGAA